MKSIYMYPDPIYVLSPEGLIYDLDEIAPQVPRDVLLRDYTRLDDYTPLYPQDPTLAGIYREGCHWRAQTGAGEHLDGANATTREQALRALDSMVPPSITIPDGLCVKGCKVGSNTIILAAREVVLRNFDDCPVEQGGFCVFDTALTSTAWYYNCAVADLAYRIRVEEARTDG